MGDDYFKPGNYRRINARLKYAKGQEISKTREYYHMPPLLSGPPVKLNNNKKYRKEEQRVTEIERANRILFEKMRNIKLKKGPYSQLDLESRKRRHSFRGRNKSPFLTYNNFSLMHFNSEHMKVKPARREAKILNHHNILENRHNSVPPRFSIQPKILYKGYKQIDGKSYNITAYIEQEEFWLKADEDGTDISNYMTMDVSEYQKLRKSYLPNGIQSLLNMIKIDKIIELKGIVDSQLVQVQEGPLYHSDQ